MGGAARQRQPSFSSSFVSIAGAILWGVLRLQLTANPANGRVSIAGAILWGVLLVSGYLGGGWRCVSIAGAILWGVLPPNGRDPCCSTHKFQSQGRFFGGCCAPKEDEERDRVIVSIAGAILWGVLPSPPAGSYAQYAQFQSQGRFFGGCCRGGPLSVLLRCRFQSQGRFFGGCCFITLLKTHGHRKFQSQGRFFGGCCAHAHHWACQKFSVSIAGAILWGVLLPGVQVAGAVDGVSIAGAILWGVLPARHGRLPFPCWFQSQGRFFGGCCLSSMAVRRWIGRFQSQGRFFGGCC